MARNAPITELRTLMRKHIAKLYDDANLPSFDQFKWRLQHMAALIDAVIGKENEDAT